MLDQLARQFASSSFLPHGYCFTWTPALLWSMVGADAVIATAYYSIPLALIVLVRKRRDLSFNWIVLMFSGFIFACGTTHVVAIWTIWHPDYWLDVLVKTLTASISIVTALMLWPLIPKVLRIPSLADMQAAQDELAKVNAELQLRIAEAERARAAAEEASHAKSEFLSRMSHELRTPLNAIVGFAQSLEQDPAVTGDLRRAERVRLIVRAGWHLTGMIGDVLDLSRIESGNVNVALGPVDLPALLQEVMALMAGQAEPEGVSLYLASLGGVRYVEADATRLRQVLVNLLSNAIKYNRSGGAVMTGAAVTADGEVAISLQDTGIGMTSAQLAALYQPFNRLGREATGRPGTGIGLVITKKLVEMMRGRIEVSSVPGEGTRFVVTLRGAQAPAAVPTMPAPLGAPSEMGPRRVMYIEDDPVNAEVMRALLSLRPRVSLAVHTTLLEGLAALRSAPPDLLLLDMQLPDGSGLELLRVLADDPLLATVPVLMVSADVMEDSIGAALKAGARAYIAKPFNFDEVLKQLDAVLAQTT